MIRETSHDVVGVEEGLFYHSADVFVLSEVEHAVPLPSAPHQPGQAQLGEVLRHRCWLGTDVVSELVDRMLTVEERPDDPQAGGIGDQFQRRSSEGDLILGRLGDHLRIHAGNFAGWRS